MLPFVGPKLTEILGQNAHPETTESAVHGAGAVGRVEPWGIADYCRHLT
jgi:hypothetical protein